MEVDKNIFTNMKALSKTKGISIPHIKAAKALNCAGVSQSGRIYWDTFEPWYKQNISAIEEYLKSDAEDKGKKGQWKERKERALALIAEIELKERENRTLDKAKTFALLDQIFGSQAIILRNMAQDLPPRLLGKNVTEMGVLLSKNYDDVCAIFKSSLIKMGRK